MIANGISLPDTAPNVARHLWSHGGYRTALIGKAHFDPHLDPLLRFPENRMGPVESNGPWRGFEHAELATHGPIGGHHYARWLRLNHPSHTAGFATVLTIFTRLSVRYSDSSGIRMDESSAAGSDTRATPSRASPRPTSCRSVGER